MTADSIARHGAFVVRSAAISALCFAQRGMAERTSVVLMPEDGTMYCNVVVRMPDRQVFALTIPEDICAARGVIIPHSARARVRWEVSDRQDRAETSLTIDEVASYDLSIVVAGEDVVEARMTIHNLGDEAIEDVWSFNCLSPVRAPEFRDEKLERTYFSRNGEPTCLADIQRVVGPRETLGVYYHERVPAGQEPAFVKEFRATNPDRTDDSWFVTLSKTGDGYMAATSPEALFLFNNQRLSCIHSAALFGDIPRGESRTVTCRFYMSPRGDLADFLERFNRDRAPAEEPEIQADQP